MKSYTTTSNETIDIETIDGVYLVEVKVTEIFDPRTYDTPEFLERYWTLIGIWRVSDDDESILYPVDVMPYGLDDIIEDKVQEMDL